MMCANVIDFYGITTKYADTLYPLYAKIAFSEISNYVMRISN